MAVVPAAMWLCFGSVPVMAMIGCDMAVVRLCFMWLSSAVIGRQ